MQTNVGVSMVGWEQTPSQVGARCLLDSGVSNLASIAVLTPGRRAGRLLQRELLRQGEGVLECPRLLTPSTLVEAFLESVDARLPVSEQVGELVWRNALCALSAVSAVLFPGQPEAPDVRASMERARRLRSVCDQLDGIGVLPSEVPAVAGLADDTGRWQALADLRTAAHRLLADEGLIESTVMRRAMIENGALRADAPDHLLVLAVSDPGPLGCAMLDLLEDRSHRLIDAPESERANFDRHGRPCPEAWNTRPSVVRSDELRLVNRPIEAGEQLLDDLAELQKDHGPLVPGRVVVGVCDETLNPLLERAGRRVALALRGPIGASSDRGQVGRLIESLRDHLEDPTIESFGALLRMPAIEALLLKEITPPDEPLAGLVGLLDRWRADRIGADLSDLRAGRSGADRHLPVGLLRQALQIFERLAAPLHAATSPLDSLEAVRTFLVSCFAEAPEDGPLREDLASLGGILDSIGRLPAGPVSTDGCVLALDLLLCRLSGMTRTPEPDPSAIELLGWLELRHEPIEDLVLVGMNEAGELAGRLADGWLPDSLRKRLGLPSDEDRFARDVHTMHVLRARVRSMRTIVQRLGSGGDPLPPSRLVLAEEGDALARRVITLFEDTPRITAAGMMAGTPSPASEEGFPAPRPAGSRDVARLNVTDFASWIRDPLGFWLQRMERIDEVDPDALELDARAFGTLAHKVLEVLEEGDLRTATDSRVVEEALLDRMHQLITTRYGRSPAPAIALQRRTLEGRLRAFARLQAGSVREGWILDESEHRLQDVPLDIPGQDPVLIRGRIDRIDRHADGRLRVLDYKTSDKPVDVGRKRGKDGVWSDLQLPLYDHLLRVERGSIEVPVELGYVSMPTEFEKTGIEIGSWSPGDLGEGIEQAQAIVKAMRAGDFESTAPARSRSRRNRKIGPMDRILRTTALDVSAAGEIDDGSETDGGDR